MAVLPIEVVRIGDVSQTDVSTAINLANLANSVQTEFLFSEIPTAESAELRMHAFTHVQAADFLDSMETFRAHIRGYHPFLIAIVDANLQGREYGNLFGSHRAEKGLAVVTIANVPRIIIPEDRMVSYFLYYFARYALSFVVPGHRNHEDTRACVFDRKIAKRDILQSMRARSLCDSCRRRLLSGPGLMSPRQFEAIDALFGLSGQILDHGTPAPSRARVLIGSSAEGLPLANKIQELLSYDVSAIVWNQGTVFGLGDSTLEALERAVREYDFAIFVFTPDDELHTRGETRPVARDNVLFELGLFIGRLTRHRAFVVHPRKRVIALPSDLSGITLATYDPDEPDLAAALGPVCNQIREQIREAINAIAPRR